jgi:hypothetical protein
MHRRFINFLQDSIFLRVLQEIDYRFPRTQIFIQWLTAGHPSQDEKAVAAIEKITIADTDHLADSWFKTEILGGLNGADVEFIDPSTNDGEYGIVAVHLTTPKGSVVLD